MSTDRFPLTAGQEAAIAALAMYKAQAETKAEAQQAAKVKAETKAQAEAKTKLVIIDPTIWETDPPPDREWLIQDWLPIGLPTVLYAEPGFGKSLLAQQLMVAGAIGGDWLGMRVPQFRSYAMFCEDDESELHSRQRHLCQRYGASMSAVGAGGMRFSSLPGEATELLTFDRDGNATETPLLAAVTAAALENESRLIVLDTAARTFGGNENERRQVTRYLGLTLSKLAREAHCAVLLLAHPSKAGIVSKSGDSGSTGWKGSARSVWTMTVPDGGPLKGQKDARMLTRVKSNGAERGVSIPTLLETKPQPLGFVAVKLENEEARHDRLVLRALAGAIAAGINVSPKKQANTYGPTYLARQDSTEGVGADAIAESLDRLTRGKKVEVESYAKTNRNLGERYAITKAGEVWLSEKEDEMVKALTITDPDDGVPLEVLLG